MELEVNRGQLLRQDYLPSLDDAVRSLIVEKTPVRTTSCSHLAPRLFLLLYFAHHMTLMVPLLRVILLLALARRSAIISSTLPS